MRTLKISRDNWFLRVFLWAWGAEPWKVDPKNLNICKLFWGMFFLPFSLTSLRMMFGYIPRLSLFWAALGGLNLLTGSIRFAALWFSLAGLVALLGFIVAYQARKVSEAGVEPGQRVDDLFFLWDRATGWAKWIPIIPLFPIIIIFLIIGMAVELLIKRIKKKVKGETLSGPISVIREYLRALKERICPRVEVI